MGYLPISFNNWPWNLWKKGDSDRNMNIQYPVIRFIPFSCALKTAWVSETAPATCRWSQIFFTPAESQSSTACSVLSFGRRMSARSGAGVISLIFLKHFLPSSSSALGFTGMASYPCFNSYRNNILENPLSFLDKPITAIRFPDRKSSILVFVTLFMIFRPPWDDIFINIFEIWNSLLLVSWILHSMHVIQKIRNYIIVWIELFHINIHSLLY